jgi:hypothetical protein
MGMISSIHHKIFIFLAVCLLPFLSACSGLLAPAVTPTPQGQLPVGSDLREIYQSLGGEPVLGPAISQPFNKDGVLCQFTTNVKMCYNPAGRNEADRQFLAPIGLQFSFQNYTSQQPGPYRVYEGFSEVYLKKFFGLRFVGQPLTGVHFNGEKGRLEQYFEKMGFYTLINDPQHAVRLLAYGSYTCGAQCSPSTAGSSGIIGWDKGIPVLNPASLARLGDYTLFGSPLSNPYIASDGNLEQVLERVVVYVPSDNPTTLRLRSMALVLNLPYSEPGPQRYGQKENMFFYFVKGDLGYHVPIVFDHFIASHGGKEISGKPLADPFEINLNGQKVARQCFENYCLDYTTSAPEAQKVALAPLGSQYIQAQKRGALEVFRFNTKMVELMTAEQKPQISSKDSQVIQIALRTRLGKQPIAEIESFVILGLPDGQKATYNLPPTDASGLAQLAIPPLSKAPNGSIIPYIVCLYAPGDEQICANESFLIWNTQ